MQSILPRHTVKVFYLTEQFKHVIVFRKTIPNKVFKLNILKL